MGSEYWIDNMVEKLNDFLTWVDPTFNTSVLTNNTSIDKAKELLRELNIEMHMNYTTKMLKSSINSLVAKIDDVFPPEARTEYIRQELARQELIRHYVHMAKPYFVPCVALLLILLFFRHKGGEKGGATVERGGATVRMMKAPGRNNVQIPRDSFQKNPRDYFRNLRG